MGGHRVALPVPLCNLTRAARSFPPIRRACVCRSDERIFYRKTCVYGFPEPRGNPWQLRYELALVNGLGARFRNHEDV